MDKVRSYVCQCVFNVQDRELLGNSDIIAKVVEKFVQAINMQVLGGVRVDTLDSPIPGIPSVSVNQPLMTSIMSADTWTEFDTLVLLVHSCQDFRDLCPSAIRETEEFLGANLVQSFYIDLSVQGNRFDPRQVSQWSLDLDMRSWTPCRLSLAASGGL